MRVVPLSLALAALSACAPGGDRQAVADRAPYPALLPLSSLQAPAPTLDPAATAAGLEAEAAALRATAASLAADGG